MNVSNTLESSCECEEGKEEEEERMMMLQLFTHPAQPGAAPLWSSESSS